MNECVMWSGDALYSLVYVKHAEALTLELTMSQ